VILKLAGFLEPQVCNMKTSLKILIGILILVLVGLSVNAFFILKSTQTFGEYDWKDDGIGLMQSELTGEFGCFGCSTPSSGQALCVDPAMEMKPVDETEELHCDGDFRVIYLKD
jgi:hypothetical protein